MENSAFSFSNNNSVVIKTDKSTLILNLIKVS